MSRELVRSPSAGAGLVLRTLANYSRFELTARCAACERFVALDPAALAGRFG